MDSKASAFNSSNNSSFSWPDTIQHKACDTDHVLRVLWFSVVFVFGCLGNFLLLAVILRKGGASNVTNLFNLNLLITDLTRIFLLVPTYLAYTGHREWPSTLGLAGCKAIFFVIQFSVIVSVQTLFFSSLERHRAVVHPLKEKMSTRQAKYLIFLSWCLAIGASIWYTVSLITVKAWTDGRRYCGPFLGRTWVTEMLFVSLIGMIYLPGTIFTVLYIKIIIKLRRDAVINPIDISQSSKNRHRRNVRAARILVTEMVLYLPCLFPFFQSSIVGTVDVAAVVNPFTPRWTIIVCAMITYSLINPFCHVLLNNGFRREVKKILHQCKMYCKPETSTGNQSP